MKSGLEYLEDLHHSSGISETVFTRKFEGARNQRNPPQKPFALFLAPGLQQALKGLAEVHSASP